MQLERVVAQPVAPPDVVGTPFGHQRPEPRTVTEDPQVGQLVDDDGLEGLGRGQDEPPREREAAAARRAPPARARVADLTRSGRRRSPRRAARCPARSRSGPGSGTTPRGRRPSSDGPRPQGGRRSGPRRRRRHAPRSTAAMRGRPARSAADGGRRDSGSGRRPQAAPGRELLARVGWRARWRRSHGSRSARNALTWRSGSDHPRRPADGTVTTTPRSGWMTTRSVRARGDRRSVYGRGPPGRRAIAGSSVAPGVERVTRQPVAADARAARPVSCPSRIAGWPLTITWSMPTGWRAGSR